MSFYDDQSKQVMDENRHRQMEAHEMGPVLPFPEDVRDCVMGQKDVGDSKFVANADHRHNFAIATYCGNIPT